MLGLTFLVFVPRVAVGQLTGEEAVALADSYSGPFQERSTIGGEAGFGAIGEDYFVNLSLAFNFDQETWGFGLQVPLRFRILDRDPKSDDFFIGLRREDWDEPSDYLRALRYVYLGRPDKRGPYYIRLGELESTTIGHGTIMSRYNNRIDVNRIQTGLEAAFSVGPFIGEIMIADLLEPQLFGLRAAIRPFDLFNGRPEPVPSTAAVGSETEGTQENSPESPPEEERGSGWGHGFIIGQSFFMDAAAPLTLAQDPNGLLLLDDHGTPVVARERALMVIGVAEISYELIDTDFLTITPYSDLNKITEVAGGWGWHAGVLYGLRVPLIPVTFQASARTEFRHVSGDYVSPYFDTVYEIERFQRLSSGGGLVQSKLLSLCGGDPDCPSNGSARSGYYFELAAGLENIINVSGEYLDYSGPRADGRLRLAIGIPLLRFLRLSAFYLRVNIEGPDDLFAIDDRSAIVAQAAIPLYGFLDIRLRWWRVWRSCGESDVTCEGDTQGFQSVDDWNVSLGFQFDV